jgi:thymidylate synthase
MKDKIINFLETLLEKAKRSGYANDVDYEYIKLCKKILKEGVRREGRNGATYSIFGAQVRFDLSKGMPLLTTKKVVTRSVVHELIWLLKGETSAKYLKDNKVGIWDLWVNEQGDLPYTYPRQWRQFPNPHGKPIDQIAKAINDIKNNPSSRRIVVSAWNPAEIEMAALPACHALFQFYVSEGKLSCQLYQRSGDAPLGICFNWYSYALLTAIVAQICGLELGEFIWTGGDVHIYENQIEALKTQFGRKSHPLPKVKINPNLKSIDELKFEDIELIGYKSEDFIKIPVSQ